MRNADSNRRGLPVRMRVWRDESGASAVEFAMLSAPFIFLILCIMQVGLYYMTQSALDGGVMKTADGLRNNFNRSGTPTMPDATTLKSTVATNSGGLVRNNATLAVEIRQLSSLSSGTVAIADGTVDYGSETSPLVLRAQSSVFTFAPGFSALAQARASAIVRRQGR
jgi:Flp pilus assembly protein TadG